MTPPNDTSPTDLPCPRCGASAGLVWVHGHGQCAACGSNVEECCQGAACEPARSAPGTGRGSADGN